MSTNAHILALTQAANLTAALAASANTSASARSAAEVSSIGTMARKTADALTATLSG